MSIAGSKGVKVKIITSATDTVEGGFQTASLQNTGSASATITQDSNTFTLLAGSVFNFPDMPGNDSWYELEVNAASTTVECVYY